MESKNITRKELYDLVWSTPITTLAKTFNVPYTYLKKKCKEASIPLPINGYWLKIKHDKKVEKTILTGNPNISVIIKKQTDEKRIESKNDFKVSKRLIKPDKLVTIAKKDLALKKTSRRSSYEKMISTSIEVINITVTPKLVTRALLFMDAFIKLAKNRGHIINYKNHYDTIIVIDGIEISIHLREKNKRIIQKDNYGWNRSELEPTGDLIFKAWIIYSKEWQDSKTVLLEDKIVLIMRYLENLAEKEKQQKIKSQLFHADRERKEKIKEQLKLRRDLEIEKFNTFIEESERFRKAEILRSYINAKETKAELENTINEDFINWKVWATSKVDWLDPLIEKEDHTLGEYKNHKQ